jgi:hypothetical protein
MGTHVSQYTNRYFENRNTFAGVKDEDVIAYYKKGGINIKLFEKIHEADAHTIVDLMASVDKLVDTQYTVMHDFNGEDHDDGGNRSRKRSGEVYATDPPRHSTFLEGDFDIVMDDQCQFHHDAKHTMRECEQLKHTLGVPPKPKKAKSDNNDDQTAIAATTTVTVDLIDVIAMTVDPTISTTIGTVVIIATTIVVMIVVMIDAMTTAATIATKTTVMTGGTTGMTSATATDVMIIIAKTTTTARNALHHHRQKGATPMARFKSPTRRSTSSLVVAKRPRATGSSDQT